MSNIIWIIVIGFIAGMIARVLSPGPNDPKGFLLTTVLGIAGAFLATFIGQTVGWYRLDQGAARAALRSCEAPELPHHPGPKRKIDVSEQFDFLGYCFRPRRVKRSRDNTLFCGFNPAVSSSALKAMRSTIRDLGIRHQTQLSLAEVARRINPLLRGWIEYYGRYAPSALYPLLRYINLTLRDWVMRKFKRFAASKSRAGCFLKKLARENADLFVHWRISVTGTFA